MSNINLNEGIVSRMRVAAEVCASYGANLTYETLTADAADMAELIDAAKHAREALAESETDPLTVGKLTRALARVGG